MQASDTDINLLLKLQEQDLASLKVKKEFEELPQRQEILQARQQLDAIQEKLGKVQSMKGDLQKKITKVMVEDEQLEQKQKDVQAAIDAAGKDFRNLEARTKELAGHGRRREALSEQLEQLDGQMSKVAAMEAQVVKMLDQVKASEARSIASFKEQGGALQAKLAETAKARQLLVSQVSSELIDIYEKTAKASGGVAVGLMNGDKCGVCRMSFDDARLMDVRRQAPLGKCPYCKRLLVVK